MEKKRIKCTSNKWGYTCITVGKVYEVLGGCPRSYLILNDWGTQDWYGSCNFTVESTRHSDTAITAIKIIPPLIRRLGDWIEKLPKSRDQDRMGFHIRRLLELMGEVSEEVDGND